MEEITCDLAVVGAGPAGLAAAITAAKHGGRVLLLERGRLPRHRVCGEFLSPESLRLLESLLGGNKDLMLRSPRISRARLFMDRGVIETSLSPSAGSIPRYELDHALWQAAQAAGAECREECNVRSIERTPQGRFHLICESAAKVQPAAPALFSVLASAVVDAAGRWSNLRPRGRVPEDTWVGLKSHFECGGGNGVLDSVDLYFFDSGYCGISPIGGGRINACAMVRASALAGNSLEKVFACHPELWRSSRSWKPAMDVIATAPLFFREPCPMREEVLVAGDAAGFVDPFIGDGISMALNSGVRAAEALSNQQWRAADGARDYERTYRRDFLPVFRNAARVRRLLRAPRPLRQMMSVVAQLPGVTRYFLQSTRLRGQV
ncbi:MAG TPA: FAD-dependent oxidoreductase [Terriglobales bacterium]|nr:FAD-dependent oxidoreductase [Terriglobales bacterium]